MGIDTLAEQAPWAAALVLIVMALVPPATALIRLRLGLRGAPCTGRDVDEANVNEEMDERGA